MKILFITKNDEGLDVSYDAGNREFVRSISPDRTTHDDARYYPGWIRTGLYSNNDWCIHKRANPTYLNTEMVR